MKTDSHFNDFFCIKSNFFLIFITICLTILITLHAIDTTYDNDLWWLLATGREILQNGFPKTNPWSIHSGQGIVIQQWIPSVILYAIYTIADLPGLEIMLVIQILIFFLLLWKMMSVLSGRKNTELLLFFILISFVSLSTYFSSRPQIYSMAFYALLITVLEKYRRSNERKYLYALPLITLCHVNMHASMAPLDFFILFLYWMPDIPRLLSKRIPLTLEFGHSQYERTPIFIASAIAGFAMFLNPYGIRGAFYLLESYGAAGYGGYISEMGNTQITSYSGFADIALIIAGSIGIGMNRKQVDFPLTTLFLSTAFISMTHERNIWLVALFSLPLVAKTLGRIELHPIRIKFLHRGPVYVVFSVAVIDFMAIYSYANIWPTMVKYIRLYKADDVDYPLQACDWLTEYAADHGLANNDLRIFNSFNNGGLLEFNDFKVTMDPRPELWEPMITGQSTHYYQEYVQFQGGTLPIKDYISKYEWDFYIVRDDSQLEAYMEENSEDYKVAKECNGYKVWTNA